MKPEHIGTAGEYRVMSELLLRGFNPARMAFDIGVDILLDSGVSIQVKTISRAYKKSYTAQLGNSRYRQRKCADIYILWCVEEDCFYVIPKGVVTTQSSLAVPSPKAITIQKGSKYREYLERWELIGDPLTYGDSNLSWAARMKKAI